MRIKPFRALTPKLSLIASVDSFFDTVREDYQTYKDAGFFETSDSDLFVVYNIISGDQVYHGIVGAADLRDIVDNKVLKHEKTLAEKEQHMIRLTVERRAQIKPVLLAYHQVAEIDAFMVEVSTRKPDYSLTFKTGHEHRLFAINSKDEIKRVQKLFSKVPKTYIADGHHRCATGQHLHETEDQMAGRIHFDSLLALYMPFNDLEIYDYNRVIDITNLTTPGRLMALLSHVCKIYPLDRHRKPIQRHEMTCCVEGHWYRLRWKKRVLKSYKNGIIFDVALLNEYVLQAIMNIQDVRSDPHITYYSGVKGLKGLNKVVQQDHGKVAFCLYPVQKSDIVETAEAGKTLPPKSTWFEPRIKNGVVGLEM